MAGDEILLELLHAELVSYVTRIENKNLKSNNLSSLEYFGFNAGYRVVERLTKDWPRFKEELDTIKFICTDFWSSIYMKPIDNLRTNHQGIYVLQDNAFRFLSKIGSGKQHLDVAPLYIAFTAGLLRGALANLGIHCLVTAEVQSMPTCKFHIQVSGSFKYGVKEVKTPWFCIVGIPSSGICQTVVTKSSDYGVTVKWFNITFVILKNNEVKEN